MMYPYPFGGMNPYGYYGYNRYGMRRASPTEAGVWHNMPSKHEPRHNAGQNVKSDNEPCKKQAGTPKQAQVKEQVQDLPPHEDRCADKPIFELFGIRLFSDDLLILAILYFLYSEGVNDPELFIALILLLIS